MPYPKGKPMSEETKAKMRQAHAGRPGRVQTAETRAKISRARRAREALKPPKSVRDKRPPRGFKLTPEHLANLRAARAGLKLSPAACARLSAARRAAWEGLSAEEREAKVARWQRREPGVVDPRRPRAKRPAGPCQNCGTDRRSLHRDHIVPRWKGGGDEPSNIQWLCANCHEEKTRLDLVGAPRRKKGTRHTAETRAKMSAAARRRLADWGYVGSSTRSEIEYAHARRVPVDYLEPVP